MVSSAPIRLVALDLDGTLVGDDLVLRPRVREAVAAAQARGVAVTIVTGRMFQAARPFARALAIDGPMVCYQGAAIFEAGTGAVLRETPVSSDVTREVLQWAHDRGVHAQCYADDTLYVEQINRFSKRYTDLARVEPVVVPSLRDAFAERPTIKIVLVDDAERADEHLAALKPLLGAREVRVPFREAVDLFDVERVVGVALRVHAPIVRPLQHLARDVRTDRGLAQHGTGTGFEDRGTLIADHRAVDRQRARKRTGGLEHPAGHDRDRPDVPGR